MPVARLSPFATLLAAAALAGCGSTQVDTTGLEHDIANLVHRAIGEQATVSCPAHIPTRRGQTTTCTLRTAAGTTGTATVTQTDDSGHATIRLSALTQTYTGTTTNNSAR